MQRFRHRRGRGSRRGAGGRVGEGASARGWRLFRALRWDVSMMWSDKECRTTCSAPGDSWLDSRKGWHESKETGEAHGDGRWQGARSQRLIRRCQHKRVALRRTSSARALHLAVARSLPWSPTTTMPLYVFTCSRCAPQNVSFRTTHDCGYAQRAKSDCCLIR